MAGRFDVVVAEALDRLSRDQEDIAGLFKRLSFAGVRIVTLAEGEIGDLHVGLKGTMNALYLKDLADKTRRGLRGRVEAGRVGRRQQLRLRRRAPAGPGRFGGAGRPTHQPGRGGGGAADLPRLRRRPVAEAHRLCSQCRRRCRPERHGLGSSTIHGNAERGTGILNNELYIGRLVWNRLRYVKDPDTGKRVSRLNPPAQWVIQDVPELRIVDDGPVACGKGPPAAGSPRLDRRGRRPAAGLGPAAAALPVLRADAMRLLRRRLHQDQRRPVRLLDGAQQGHLHQPADHPPRRDRGQRAGRPEGAADGTRTLFKEFCAEFHRGTEPAAPGRDAERGARPGRAGDGGAANRQAGGRAGRRHAGPGGQGRVGSPGRPPGRTEAPDRTGARGASACSTRTWPKSTGRRWPTCTGPWRTATPWPRRWT